MSTDLRLTLTKRFIAIYTGPIPDFLLQIRDLISHLDADALDQLLTNICIFVTNGMTCMVHDIQIEFLPACSFVLTKMYRHSIRGYFATVLVKNMNSLNFTIRFLRSCL